MPSFTSLAEDILAAAKRLDEHLASQGKPASSFDQDTLEDLPPNMEATRSRLINTTQTLKQLAQGPHDATLETMFSWTTFLSLRAIYTYNLASYVPLTGTTTYTDLSAQSSLPAPLIRRFFRLAIATHMFGSPTPDTVAHTAASRLFLTDPNFPDATGLQTAELGPASARMVDAITKYGADGEPGHTAYALQHGAPIFDVLGKDPERARRFGAAMKYYTKGSGYDLKHLVEGFDWAALDQKPCGATVVDVGGGHGAVSQALAKATTNTHFVVQDLPGTVEQAAKDLPKELQGRIEFVPHDFFTEQPVDRDADIFLLRWILHNWSDAYCLKILKALVPALKRKEQRVLIYEYLLPETPGTDVAESFGAYLDMVMLCCFNGAERTEADFKRLLHAADPGFRIESIKQPEAGAMSIIEVSLSSL
ncbi:MAG: hypothetical protein Q9184_006719 [Pyrenodesmia sp. 2 TL-2023]